ncbi:MAG: enoyl-CoA hydratase/isomerase family protein [Myxococcales bacterium]|nr:enoyl-CoA hydratase/isomerase family protein [Myxococcales bacterium]
MPDNAITLEQAGQIAYLRFQNPPRHTLTATMVGAMTKALGRLAVDTRVLVLRSATPGVFITHYEVGELSAAAERSAASQPPAAHAPSGTAETADTEQLHELHQLIVGLEQLDLITVAAIDGLAMGGGLELALGCDFRLLRDGTHVLGLPETTVGIIPGAGGTQRLTRLLGSARALDLILHAQLLRPSQALELGLVHRVFADADFERELGAFVDDLAARAPLALAAAKRAIRQGQDMPLRQALALEQREFQSVMGTEDARNAMAAYLKGRRPSFQGR